MVDTCDTLRQLSKQISYENVITEYWRGLDRLLLAELQADSSQTQKDQNDAQEKEREPEY